MNGGVDYCASGADAKAWLAHRRFVVVPGAMKGGTCALRRHLLSTAWTDNMSLPSREVHFFDDDEEYARGLEYYTAWFQWNNAWNPPSIVGDITPSYLYLPWVIPRIRCVAPHALFIAMLRNPIERASSHHNHDLAKGRDVGLLRNRLECELRDVGQASHRPSRSDVFARGLYYDQVKRLLRHFPRQQVHVVISERYRCQPQLELQRVRTFLGLVDCRLDLQDNREVHVRGSYMETLQATDRQFLYTLYKKDVNNLKLLLKDDIPEWEDFVSRSVSLGDCLGAHCVASDESDRCIGTSGR